jgi:uncharacterized membrane protein
MPFSAHQPASNRDGFLSTFASQLAFAALPSLLAMGILFARLAVIHRLAWGFLVWNLFLAWLPLGFAVAAHAVRSRSRLLCLALLAIWLLFLPNAPYILTDVVHALRGQHYWYDLAMILTFAMAGVSAGVASMRVVHRTLTTLIGPLLAAAAVAASAMLSGVGIYLGRVLRWNSWDVVVRPDIVWPKLFSAALSPWDNRHAVAFAILFGTIFGMMYVLLQPRVNRMTETKSSGRANGRALAKEIRKGVTTDY